MSLSIFQSVTNNISVCHFQYFNMSLSIFEYVIFNISNCHCQYLNMSLSIFEYVIFNILVCHRQLFNMTLSIFKCINMSACHCVTVNNSEYHLTIYRIVRRHCHLDPRRFLNGFPQLLLCASSHPQPHSDQQQPGGTLTNYSS